MSLSGVDPAEKELRALIVDAYSSEIAAMRQTAVNQLLRLAGGATDLGNVELVASFADLVLAAQSEAGAYAVEYVNTIAGSTAADDAVVNASRYVGRATRGDTLLETVYHRPALAEAEALNAGLDAEQAREIALNVLSELGDTDVAVAARLAESAAMTENPLIGSYIRVPDGSACAFCWLIADREYRTDELAPAHNFCRCSVEPIAKSESRIDTRESLAAEIGPNGEVILPF